MESIDSIQCTRLCKKIICSKALSLCRPVERKKERKERLKFQILQYTRLVVPECQLVYSLPLWHFRDVGHGSIPRFGYLNCKTSKGIINSQRPPIKNKLNKQTNNNKHNNNNKKICYFGPVLVTLLDHTLYETQMGS